MSGCKKNGPNGKDESTCVKVVVRVRPALESGINDRKIIRTVDSKMLIFDPKEEIEFYFQGQKHSVRDFSRRPNKDTKFIFDHVFGEDSTNEEVFECTTKNMINELLNGINCSVFAYGATGAGKTFTMLGSSFKPGIVFMTVMELYNRIEEIKDDQIFTIKVSYLEVYNETVRDLLNPSNQLIVREDPERGVVVNGLSYHEPNGAGHLLNLLQQGNCNRTQHPTDANSESSRSHAVFQVYVQQKEHTKDLSSVVRIAKMSLVDLAGSEKAKVALGAAARLREGANINRSLLALGSCINALADRKQNKNHIPYRNSKLTRILKDSLGGNCKTVMIAAISSTTESYDDTYNTLKYADRAKNIRLNLKQNIMSVDNHISRYVKIIEDLRDEITRLKEKLQTYDDKLNQGEIQAVSTSEMDKWKEKIENIFNKRIKLRKNILEYIALLHQLQAKMHWKMIGMERLALLSFDDHNLNRSCTKIDTSLRSLQNKQNHIRTKKLELDHEWEVNTKALDDLEKELMKISNNKELFQKVSDYLKHYHLQLRNEELTQQEKHSKELILLQESESTKCHRLLNKLLNLVHHEHLLLNSHGFATSELQVEYDAVIRATTGIKGVAWADQDDDSDEFKLENIIDIINPSENSLKPLSLPKQMNMNFTYVNKYSSALKRLREDDESETRSERHAKRSLNQTFNAEIVSELASALPSTPLSKVNETFTAISPYATCIQNQTFNASPAMYLNCTFTPQNVQNLSISAKISPCTSCQKPEQRQVLQDLQNTPDRISRFPSTQKCKGNVRVLSNSLRRQQNRNISMKSNSNKQVSTGFPILDKVYQNNLKVDLGTLRKSQFANLRTERHRKSATENCIKLSQNKRTPLNSRLKLQRINSAQKKALKKNPVWK
ncbi:kinesin-like protein KIF18A isoform X1 [Centruroides vittatus]|uniref:kinesin-like protein KIF18A isoform X1 n=1 Tax=Centruroides vittatus TaxID=120091 RepID=UPI0035104A88